MFSEGNYRVGQKDGTWFFHDEDGTISREETWEDGVCVAGCLTIVGSWIDQDLYFWMFSGEEAVEVFDTRGYLWKTGTWHISDSTLRLDLTDIPPFESQIISFAEETIKFADEDVTYVFKRTELEPGRHSVESLNPEIIQLVGILLQIFENVFFAVMAMPDLTGTVPGEGGGSVEVGEWWEFKDYSLGAGIKLNGSVSSDLVGYGIRIAGIIDVVGITTTTIVIRSMGLQLDNDIQPRPSRFEIDPAEHTVRLTGNISINDIEYDVRILSDAISEVQAAAAGG